MHLVGFIIRIYHAARSSERQMRFLFMQRDFLTASCLVRLCVPHMFQHGSHWTDFREIWYWGLLWKCVEKPQILLKSDKNIWHLTWRPKGIYGVGSRKKSTFYLVNNAQRTHCCISVEKLNSYAVWMKNSEPNLRWIYTRIQKKEKKNLT